MKLLKLITALCLIGVTCLAQNTEKKPNDLKFYKLTLALKEMEAGKILGSRTYNLGIGSNSPLSNASIRTGDRVPTIAGKDGQFNYVDVGINIDIRFWSTLGDELTLQITGDVSSLVEKSGGGPPVVNQTKWSTTVAVQFNKPTTVFTSDGASTKRQLQLEITATPVQ